MPTKIKHSPKPEIGSIIKVYLPDDKSYCFGQFAGTKTVTQANVIDNVHHLYQREVLLLNPVKKNVSINEIKLFLDSNVVLFTEPQVQIFTNSKLM